MTPKSTRRIIDIEALRAVAILLVFFHHFRSSVVWWSTDWKVATQRFLNGGVGVDLFFVVSGFVIGRSVLNRFATARAEGRYKTEVVAFFLRRAWRLLPSAWLWLLIPLGLVVAFNDSGAFGSVRGNLQAAGAAFLHVANFYYDWANQLRSPELENVVYVYWSLSLEEQFYLVLPLLVLLSGRRLPYVLAFLVSVQLFLIDRDAVRVAHIRTEGLFAGLLWAWAQRTRLPEFVRPTWLERDWIRPLFLVLCTATLALAGSGAVDRSYRAIPVLLITFSLIGVASYDAGYIVRGRLWSRASEWLGARSYSLYLIHVPAFALVREVFHRFDPKTPVDWRSSGWIAAYLATAAIVPFVLSDLNYRYIEVPLRNRGRRIAQRYLDRRRHAGGTKSW